MGFFVFPYKGPTYLLGVLPLDDVARVDTVVDVADRRGACGGVVTALCFAQLRSKGRTMPGGHPTALTDTLKLMMRHYIEHYEDYGDLIPSIAGFAVASKVSREQLHEWRRENVDSEFSHIFRDLLATQEKALLAGGLSKQFSAPITALVLSKHNYAAKTDVVSSDGSMSPGKVEAKVVDALVNKLID